MKRFIEGEERSQITLLPECPDDYIADDNPVRVVDVFVDELRLHKLGPVHTTGRRAPGRPKALGKARCAARAGRPGKRRNAAQRLGVPRPAG